MRDSIKKIDERYLNWEEVENKIAILCRKFDNIDRRYRDDLAQELRIHAYYVSDDYYDLQRRAIDFWRSMCTKVYPETPYIDLDLLGKSVDPQDIEDLVFEGMVEKIKKELTRGLWDNVYAKELDEIAMRILNIILEDIKGSKVEKKSILEEEAIASRYTKGGRINCTFIDSKLPEIHYKRIRKAVKRLEEVTEALRDMGKI